MEADKILKLLRLRNHLTRVIVFGNHYLAIRPLESVKAYN
jgi:ribosomal protein L30/L7E